MEWKNGQTEYQNKRNNCKMNQNNKGNQPNQFSRRILNCF